MWVQRVSEVLVEFKREGRRFEESWELALELHPPMRRDRGAAQQTLAVADDRDDPQEEPLVDFFYRAARDAWFGRRPVLAHLGHLLELLEEVDAAVAARSIGPRGHGQGVDRLVA